MIVFRGSAYRTMQMHEQGRLNSQGFGISAKDSNGRVWGMGTFSGYDPTELAWPQVESLAEPLREEDAHTGLAQARICFICRQIFPRQILIQTGKFLSNLR